MKRDKIKYILILCLIIIFTFKTIFKKNNLKFKNSIKELKSLKLINPIKYPELYLISFNNFEFDCLKDKYYNITNFKYLFSFVYKIVKVEYNFCILDKNKKIISSSDLSLYDNVHIFCHFEISNQKISIDSLANIYENKIFNCIEFFKINDKVKFGIKLLKKGSNEYLHLYHFTEEIFDYNNIIYIKDNIFSPYYIYKNHEALIEMLKNEKLKKKFSLKNNYIKFPLPDLKRNAILDEGDWIFQNIYNNYFCFCKGQNCSSQKVPQSCKYDFYKYIIDNNRNVYQKTDYLFIDFIFKEFGEDDTYPVFKKMDKDNSSHYLTEKSEIYKKYCLNQIKCAKIIPMDRELYNSYGDFIEKYLTLILKLKAVISAKENRLHKIANLFYIIEYITYISVGHGLCYFKDFLYYESQIYGTKMNNKLLIPPSKIIVNLAKKYGWKDEDLIKINLPRWDKYNYKNNNVLALKNNGRIKNNSILIMFTWREVMPHKRISPYYFNNITDLITNKILLKLLNNKNITLYFTMHRFLYFFNLKKFQKLKNHSNYIFINQNEISECLSKIDLIVTDFSSVVFDVMYRNKAFIIYFPDFDEPNIDKIYTQYYSYVIRAMKNNTFRFKNIYFTLNETIEKIIYYINNNFTIEKELKPFYESFFPEKGESIPTFIEYLKKLT